jgi:DNA (cytosine-5)-methyltransferase 1
MTATDLFCGAGGASEGLKAAGIQVVQAVNHDPLAIAAHEANHPDTAHYVEDITQLDAGRLCRTNILWASLECTNFSNAKGGKPRDADSRSLADHMPRYILAIQPDVFVVENVREFLAWGPLDAKGKPVSRTKGLDFLRWFAEIEALGYRGKWTLLNAADYGARTSRTRLFIVFVRTGLPSVNWPAATHSKGGKTHGTAPWLPVAPCLELDKPGQSIFTRSKPLSEKTLQRLLAGLLKYVGTTDPAAFLLQNNFSNAGAPLTAPAKTATTNGGNQFLVSYYGSGTQTRSITEPGPTVVTKDRHAIVQPFLMQSFGGPVASKSTSADEPARTVLANPNQQLVQPFLLNPGWFGATAPLDAPAPTVIARQDKAPISVVQPWLMKYLSNPPSGKANPGQPITEPAPTATTQDRIAVVQPLVMGQQSGSFPRPATEPAPTVSTAGAQQLIQLAPFLDKRYGSGPHNTAAINQPAGTVSTNDHHALVQPVGYIMRTDYGNVGTALDEPAATVVASRRHPYLVQAAPAQAEPPCWTEQPDDSETMRHIRAFCRAHGIADVLMRMLFVAELSRIQGFPEGYTLTGGQTNQKKQLGNAVEVKTATALGRMLAALDL